MVIRTSANRDNHLALGAAVVSATNQGQDSVRAAAWWMAGLPRHNRGCWNDTGWPATRTVLAVVVDSDSDADLPLVVGAAGSCNGMHTIIDSAERHSKHILDNIGIRIYASALPSMARLREAERQLYGTHWLSRLWYQHIRRFLFPTAHAVFLHLYETARREAQVAMLNAVLETGSREGVVTMTDHRNQDARRGKEDIEV
jgi:hypothetical protein